MGSKRSLDEAAGVLSAAEDPEDPTTSPPVARRPRLLENKENHDANADAAAAVDNNDEDDDDEVPLSPIQKINKAGRSPEAGIITEVYVENFMCHRKLTIKLCNNVNFIHGQNGSGKSAILAAIQICLGAGARRTHRARNLKELVRKEAGENCTGAKVRVTILNRGEDGYEQDTYGDTITVERTISLRGGGYNGYKLLDHEKKERSRSKKDLDAMLDKLNIQVENPVAVLDQEESKKFLTGKAEDKYSFFLKATELERIDRSYAAVLDNLKDLGQTRDRVRDSLQPAIDNVDRLKKEYEQFKELDILEAKVQDYKVNFGWAYYNECEESVQQEEQTLKKFLEKKEKREQELTQVESLTSGPDDDEARLRDRMDELIEEAQTAANDKKSLESELKRAQVPVKSKERELSSLKQESAQAQRNLKQAKKYLQEERAKIIEQTGSAKSREAERAAKLQKCEEELEELRGSEKATRQLITESLRKYEELEPHAEQAKQDVASLRSQKSAIEHKIRDLQSSGGSSLAVFGQKCTRVHRLVQELGQQGQWSGKVVGPIGSYIKIAPGKEKFASIAEFAIGPRTLDRYIVTNDQDRRKFLEIRQRAGCSTPECGVFQVVDQRRHPVPPPPCDGVETVASCLNISEDLVFNCLVDQSRIDQKALTVSKEPGEKSLLLQDNRGKHSIRGNIKDVYFLPRGDYWKVMDGNLTMTSNSKSLRQSIGVDKSAAIAQAKGELEQIQRELRETSTESERIQGDYKAHKVTWNNERKGLRKIEGRVEQVEAEIGSLKNEAEEETEDTNIDTTELEEDVAKAEQVVETIQERQAKVEEEIANLAPGVDDVKARLEEVTARNERVIADMDTAEEEMQNLLKTQSQQQAQVEKRRAKVKQMEDLISKQESILQEKRNDSTEALRRARQIHFKREADKERKQRENEEGEDMVPSVTGEEEDPSEEQLEDIEPIRPDKESSYYKTKAQRAQKQLERERQRRSLTETDEGVAYEKYMRANNDLRSKMKQIDAIENNMKVLTDDLRARKKLWREFQNHISDMTSETFDEILNTKGSSGVLEFDHKEGTLDLVVQKDNTQESSQTKDVKALSGGERSFTTLSLLLALGERLETPFRVMDEFDVFLDPVSRKIALELLVSMAKEMKHRQFIFITPQDVSSLEPGPLLKIHKMKPPARSDLVGGLSQQTLDFGTQGSG